MICRRAGIHRFSSRDLACAAYRHIGLRLVIIIDRWYDSELVHIHGKMSALTLNLVDLTDFDSHLLESRWAPYVKPLRISHESPAASWAQKALVIVESDTLEGFQKSLRQPLPH